MVDAEDKTKPSAPSGTPPESRSESKEPVGHVTDELVLSKDGLPLFPQPVLGDDLDPLNWSSTQKHTILAIVMSL
jgi:hypothetical protein